MLAAAHLRDRIEAALAHRIPGALSPKPRIIREFVPTGIRSLDELLQGGFPASAITEIVGTQCSGRTSLALSLIAGLTQAGKVCAWIDVSDALHPESAAAAGVDLPRLLWMRCGAAFVRNAPPVSLTSTSSEFCATAASATVPEKYFVPRPVTKGLHGGGFGPHPRNEVKGLSNAIAGLLGKEKSVAQRIGLAKTTKSERKNSEWGEVYRASPDKRVRVLTKPWSRLDQALRAADLLLQNGGFAAIVLDMADIAPEQALRVPLATWFRYRAVAEQKQTSLILLLQHPCAKSSAALTLRLHTGKPRSDSNVLAGVDFVAEVERLRFSPNPPNFANLRKPPQTQRWARWQSRTAWTGR
jgi:recombination protein RecA